MKISKFFSFVSGAIACLVLFCGVVSAQQPEMLLNSPPDDSQTAPSFPGLAAKTEKKHVNNESSVPVINIYIGTQPSAPVMPAMQPLQPQVPPQAILFVPVDQPQPMMMQPGMVQPMMQPGMMQQSMMQSLCGPMMQPGMMQPGMMQQPMMMQQPYGMVPGGGYQQIATDPYHATPLQPSVVAPSTVVYPNGVMVKPKVYIPGRFCHNFFQAITP